MFDLLFRHDGHRKLPRHIIIISMISFILVNFTENLVHYSIGRNEVASKYSIRLHRPTFVDFMKIVVIMILFGILQAYVMYWLY
jgi:hypothetical protein